MNWETEQVFHLVSGNFGQEDYDYWNEAAEVAIDGNRDRTRAILVLGRRMEAELTEAMPETEGLWGSFLKGALSEVDWREVAEVAIEGAE